MPNFFERLQHGWNAFRGRDRPVVNYTPYSYVNPDRVRLRCGHERSLVTAIYNRLAMDVASNKIEHIIVDSNGRYNKTVDDGLNTCLTLEANIDQTSRGFIQDAVLTMFDDGYVALVPIDTSVDPSVSASYDIRTMRVGQITQWHPEHFVVKVYNEKTGKKEEVLLPKRIVAAIQNPFYSVMNEPNSTLQRLMRKLSLLDAIDEQSSAGKLDLIVQLPYTLKSPLRREQAEQRRKDIEEQLANTKYGIAYTDGTERITQLNRPLENNLMSQIEYLMNTLYSQLGITPEILNGTANETVMRNYNTRTIEPILSAFTDEMKRKFLTKTARTQKQRIMYFRDPFKLVQVEKMADLGDKLIPINNIADIADKFTRNEILSPNEVRGIIGFKPASDKQADQLRNRNISQSPEAPTPALTGESENQSLGLPSGNQNGSSANEMVEPESEEPSVNLQK